MLQSRRKRHAHKKSHCKQRDKFDRSPRRASFWVFLWAQPWIFLNTYPAYVCTRYLREHFPKQTSAPRDLVPRLHCAHQTLSDRLRTRQITPADIAIPPGPGGKYGFNINMALLQSPNRPPLLDIPLECLLSTYIYIWGIGVSGWESAACRVASGHNHYIAVLLAGQVLSQQTPANWTHSAAHFWLQRLSGATGESYFYNISAKDVNCFRQKCLQADAQITSIYFWDYGCYFCRAGSDQQAQQSTHLPEGLNPS